MRERTPSADDTPKRAPPAPARELTPADAAGSKTVSSAKGTPGTTTTLVVAGTSGMVASLHSLDELGGSHAVASANVDRQQQDKQTQQLHYRSGQSAQDKRSRLSTVINNLRKKVPEGAVITETPKKEEDERNSVERNLETLEKYVMTVLNGVIEDDGETEDNQIEKIEENVEVKVIENEDEDSKGPTARFEPSKPNESRSEVAILPPEQNETLKDDESEDCKKTISKDTSDEISQQDLDEKKENRSLGEIIMERLNDHQEEHLEIPPETSELRNICRDLLNDLLNGINQLIDEKSQSKSESEEYPKSLHCSLPLDKVASVLQNCQNDTIPKTKPTSPTVRHLCLYCDRKFLSISLRQRHTERVHQLGGGRRSERNSRRPSQNCQYCSDKCAESLDGLFQHMVGNHSDKYYACVQCSTRYPSREALTTHTNENHPVQEKTKDLPKETKEKETKKSEYRKESLMKTLISPVQETNPESPEFDSTFYSSVSCNIRENLLHHLDGKLQSGNSEKHQFYEPNNQIQFPIDISLTAATPVYSKEYGTEEYENSSEYAQKPGKSRNHPRRVSFEKYNFPRKYDGREQWTCSIKDLSKFDISTQLTLRRKQQLLKERPVRSKQNPENSTERTLNSEDSVEETNVKEKEEENLSGDQTNVCDSENSEKRENQGTEFSTEFSSFLRLRKWDESSNEAAKAQEIVYAELTGEWSRPRIYICGACTSKHVTLREMEDHKAISHPNVWCSHFEFSGDQRELYKHLFLPGRSVPTAKARNAVLMEKICTKCTKSCNSLAELHRHMLECGGDQAWLLGLFGNGKKKCKWRPFGSRSRRRRQRGMKRNIQNSQTPRSNAAREKQPAGPRIRPSDRESIQKMLANLPAKRATRKVLQDSTLRAQGRLRNVQTRSRPRIIDNNSSASRLSRNKAALRNKLLKNAKSIQRNRCRSDNISAVIESVVSKYHTDEIRIGENSRDKETKENVSYKSNADEYVRGRGVRGPKRRSHKILSTGNNDRTRSRERMIAIKARNKTTLKNLLKNEDDEKKRESNDSKLRSPSQTLLKKKRSIDPLASLNASIKAKSQLRTQDGKFAKNPNKDPSPLRKSSGNRLTGRPVGRPKNENRDTSVTKSKLRTVPRSRSTDSILPKRTMRLSSDSDKMPTLEPAIQNMNEEFIEPTTHDLPILSPVTSCDQKTRASLKNSELEKEGKGRETKSRTNSKTRNLEESKGEVKRVFKQGRGRPRNDAKLTLKKGEKKKEEIRVPKVRGRKSLKLNPEKEQEDISPRNSSRIKDDTKEKIKIDTVPFEVKKLIGSANKEDLITKLNLSRDGSSKRNLRQLGRSSLGSIGKSKESEETGVLDGLKRRRQSLDLRRRSPRAVEKKISPENVEDASKLTRNRRSCSLSTEARIPSPETVKSDNEIKGKKSEEEPEESNDSKKSNSTKKREGRRSVATEKVQENEETVPIIEPEEPTSEIPSEDSPKPPEIPEKESSTPPEEKPEETKQTTPQLEPANADVNQLQLETSNSLDSGKENSLELRVTQQKQRAGRPKKSWGAKRERTSKRSLNNVIGILTEGMNIPVETQSIDHTNLDVQCNPQQAEEAKPNLDVEEKNLEEDSELNSSNTVEDSKDESSGSKTEVQTNKDEPVTPETLKKVTDVSVIEKSPVSPANDIILDLSRRRSSSKGSFLERIVSKIAKQKDALLEGEVGSLLDTAADELSSILDEVPQIELHVNESKDDTKLGKTKEIRREDIKIDVKEIEDDAKMKEPDVIEDSPVIESKELEVESKVPEESMDNGEIEEKIEAPSLANGVCLPPMDDEPEIDDSEKSERKSKKRSLETNSPKKNKRLSVEPVDPEEVFTEEINLADIMSLIQKSNQAITDNKLKSTPEIDTEKVLPGKRKTLEDTKNEFTEEINETTLNSEDNLECSKKLKVDVKESEDDPKQVDEICQSNPEDITLEKEEDEPKSRTGKRKSEIPDESLDTETYKGTSKRRSFPETIPIEKKLEISDELPLNSESIPKLQESISNLQMPFPVPQKTILRVPEISKLFENSASFHKTIDPPEMVTITLQKNFNVPNESHLLDIVVPKVPKKRGRKKKSQDEEESLNLENLDNDTLESPSSTPTKKSMRLNPIESSDNFKIPEVTEVLQKKRTSKRKSLPEELPEDQVRVSKEPVIEKEEMEEEKLEKPIPGFVDLIVPTTIPKTLTEEITESPSDINESLDSLSETSCTSEASNSRKKRLSKKKKSVDSDSESLETERNSERRQRLTRKAKRSNSFSYEDSAFVYDFEGRSLRNLLKDVKVTPEETRKENDDSKTNVPENENNDLKETLNSEKPDQEITKDGQKEEDFQTPKKRGAGNFVVVHTKTGEILIVEKRKKLTKEAARFFCDVCATSFTRKSSLKKHNLSQSHLLQVSKSSKEKGTNGKSDDIKCDQSISDISVDDEKPKDVEDKINDEDKTLDSSSPYQFPIQPNSIMEQESLEDELLDEEICKITENMSHDEYVLTDHVSPLAPEVTSTPVKAVIVETEVPKKRKAERKREKSKKKNLTEEQAILEPEKEEKSIEPSNLNVDLPLSPKKIPEEPLEESMKDLEVKEDTEERKRCLELEVSESPTKLKEDDKEIEEKIPEKVITRQEGSLKITISKKSLDSSGYGFEINQGKSNADNSVVNETNPIDASNLESQELEETKQVEVESKPRVRKGKSKKSHDTEVSKKSARSKRGQSKRRQTLVAINKEEEKEKLDVKEVEEQVESSTELNKTETSLIHENSVESLHESEKEVIDKESIINPVEEASNSSFADKPLSELLSNIDTKVDEPHHEKVEENVRVLTPEKLEPTLNEDGDEKLEIEQSPNLVIDSPKDPEEILDTSIKENGDNNLIMENKLSDNESKNDKPEIVLEEKQTNDTPIKIQSPKKSPKVHRSSKETKKKSKTVRSKSRKSLRSKFLNLSSESEESDSEIKNESQKGKIVKSVFGRVFGGEKIDKVKEVLNDWVSKSEDDSESSRLGLESTPPKEEKRVRKSSKEIEELENPRNRKKEIPSLPTSAELDVTSRARQSKKRAEERISQEMYFESLIFNDMLDPYKSEEDFPKVKNSKPKLETVKSKETLNEPAEEPNETKLEIETITKKRRKSSGSRRERKKPEENWTTLNPEDSESITNGTTKPEELSVPEEAKSLDTKTPNFDSENSSLGPSTPCCSPSPNNSQSTDTEENHEERRMSPLFARSTPDSSLESSNSENEETEPPEDTKRTPTEFCEKIIIRSPSSKKSEVVTITPTDAIEDNALDVPQEEAEKPRQGKILNFDEELFVECCSRLKATTENELRGAKKIKLDHSEGYHRKDDQDQSFKLTKDRWRDVESQNSLGSLLESVNQLLGEEMYTKERRNARSEQSSRSGSPDISRSENLGYEDSLDVAFEHNNKLRDKIQQRMRESENLIASSFGNKQNHPRHRRNDVRNPYEISRSQNTNGVYEETGNTRVQDTGNKIHVQPSRFKSEMNSALGGLLDKALSNLLHSNGKHDQNGSTPMKVLAELACAQAPTSTTPIENEQVLVSTPNSTLDPVIEETEKEQSSKKPRNPIKELFERKKINERKERTKTEALRELNVQKQRKATKPKKGQDFPLIRRSEHGGMVERKKRRETERKDQIQDDRIKDVYDFDEEESQMEPTLGTVMSYRSRSDKNYEVSCVRTKEVDVAGLMSKAIGESLENGKIDALGTRLESMIDKKFKELEKFAPKTKGALKAFQGDDHPRITGPMDDFVERKQKSKRITEQNLKQPKLKKRNKNSKKKGRHAWYENDSSDEFRSMAKTEEVGVGITKSQRACSRGKQNLFAELSTSSESEVEDDEEFREEIPDKNNVEEEEESEKSHRLNWDDLNRKNIEKSDLEHKKSESELSDQPLIIDERKDVDEHRNTDEETENQYDRVLELDDLYREDSSVADSDIEESLIQPSNDPVTTDIPEDKLEIPQDDDLIPLEEALDLLDQQEEILNNKYKHDITESEQMNLTGPLDDHSSNNPDEIDDKSPIDEQDDEDDIPVLPEKLTSNEKPPKESENLPLHVFLSRKVQESKKRKEQQLKKLQEEQERILLDFQPTRRQRKCAIGKQGLLAEISSSDEETYTRDSRRISEKSDHDKSRKPKRESKEKRKERYIEKKHEQMIAKEQKAIEEEILREVGKKKDTFTEVKENLDSNEQSSADQDEETLEPSLKKKQSKDKRRSSKPSDTSNSDDALTDVDTDESPKSGTRAESALENESDSSMKQKKVSKSPTKSKKSRSEVRTPNSARKTKQPIDKSKNRGSSATKDKERRSSNGKRDSDDEELKTTKSWNKVEEGVGVAIGRRKRAAANQLYYWSSSSDEEELLETTPIIEEEEDDRQEQHGWIVGDSHKRMITMLAMEKQLKEKRRRSEDEIEAKGKKKHRNSTS